MNYQNIVSVLSAEAEGVEQVRTGAKSNKRKNKAVYFFSQAFEGAGFLNSRIGLANHPHVTGPASYDTAHGSDFLPLNAVPKFRS